MGVHMMNIKCVIGKQVFKINMFAQRESKLLNLRSGSGIELRTPDYENPGSNPVLRC